MSYQLSLLVYDISQRSRIKKLDAPDFFFPSFLLQRVLSGLNCCCLFSTPASILENLC